MNYHQNARLTVQSRAEMIGRVQAGSTLRKVAADFGVSAKTAGKWVRRFREQGVVGLRDRTSRPLRLRQPTAPDKIRLVEALRRERWTGLRISLQTGLSRATVSRILRRLKLSRMRELEPQIVAERYEHAAPGDLLHLDIKKLGRIVRPSHRVTGNRRDSVDGAGWEHVHVAIDDHSRIAFSAVLPDERQESVLAFERCSGLLSSVRDSLPCRADRQRLGVSKPGVRRRVSPSGVETPFHPPIHAAYERES